ncbi:hypothetical protein [Streptomyces sp. NPDC051704]|uniref:hypothetical protein n=1 Tax=Streptomyces sp. NPDC051704 TaxID=3365671 RepID=UPI00379AFB92
MMTTGDRVQEIVSALRRRDWLPSEAERQTAASLIHRRRTLMDHLDQQPDTPATLEEGMRIQQELADQILGEVLPEARSVLGTSPVVDLIDAYVAALRAMAPYAKKLRPLRGPEGALTEYDVLTPQDREAMHDAWAPIIAAGSVLGAVASGDVN